MSYIVNITTTNITNLGTCHIRHYSLHKIFHFECEKFKYYVLCTRKMPSDDMHFRPRFNQLVSMLTNYRRCGKFTDSMMTNYRHPFVFQELQTKNVVDIKKIPYCENINFILTKYNVSISPKKMEQDSDNFAMDIRIRKKSAFMLLSFQDRVIKLRNYFRKEEHSFLGMSKEKKRDFRRLAKQFSLDKDDNFTILKKTRIA